MSSLTDNIKIEANHISVDSGMILICDKQYYEKHITEKNINIESHQFQTFVRPGKFLTRVTTNGYNSIIEKTEILDLPTGQVIISDPCYIIKSQNWLKWLDIIYTGFSSGTADLSKVFPEEGTIILDEMGGDGSFNVELLFLEEING